MVACWNSARPQCWIYHRLDWLEHLHELRRSELWCERSSFVVLSRWCTLFTWFSALFCYNIYIYIIDGFPFCLLLLYHEFHWVWVTSPCYPSVGGDFFSVQLRKTPPISSSHPSIGHWKGLAVHSYKLVYNPMKTVDISPTETIIVGVINQLSYLGAPPCRLLHAWCSCWVMQHEENLSFSHETACGLSFLSISLLNTIVSCLNHIKSREHATKSL